MKRQGLGSKMMKLVTEYADTYLVKHFSIDIVTTILCTWRTQKKKTCIFTRSMGSSPLRECSLLGIALVCGECSDR